MKTRSIVVAKKEARRLWVQMKYTEYTMNNYALERYIQESNEGRKLFKRFLVAQIKSRETGILEGEEVDNFFVDYENTESKAQFFLEDLIPIMKSY